jgi:hypothetical protein
MSVSYVVLLGVFVDYIMLLGVHKGITISKLFSSS